MADGVDGGVCVDIEAAWVWGMYRYSVGVRDGRGAACIEVCDVGVVDAAYAVMPLKHIAPSQAVRNCMVYVARSHGLQSKKQGFRKNLFTFFIVFGDIDFLVCRLF